MYYPETFFSKQVLEETLNLYVWPEKYVLKEEGAGSVLITFPECTIIVYEGFESRMIAYFVNEETGRSNVQESLTIFDAVEVLRPGKNLSGQELEQLTELIDFFEVDPSLAKVKEGLKNICILLQVYLLPCLKGDFSWVEDYKKLYPENS